MPAVKPEWQYMWDSPIEGIRELSSFKNPDQAQLFVGQGIGGPDGKWATYERKPNGSLRRKTSKYLPERDSKEDAERDLYVWSWFIGRSS